MNSKEVPASFLKIIIVGDPYSGKSSLLKAFSQRKFVEEYEPTVLDFFKTYMVVDKIRAYMDIYDTAGEEGYDHARSWGYSRADAFIICFSVIDAYTYKNVRLKWSKEVQEFNPNKPIILVGTKKDLRSELSCEGENFGQGIDFILPEEGYTMAEKIGALDYIECSAKTMEGIQQVFETAVKVGATTIKDRSSEDTSCSIQ